MAAKFVPRRFFPDYGFIPRSYYLGHHKAAMKKMRDMLSYVDYIIECRDFRAPMSSMNPIFEEALGETKRMIVYTKTDLGAEEDSVEREYAEKIIRSFDPKTFVFFGSTGANNRADIGPILEHLSKDVDEPDKLFGTRVMCVGMPNVGKSTLINNLRNLGSQRRKVVKTGDQPGITRKIATPVRITEREDGSPIYMLDTPGVFMPYVPDAETMLKLALCGCVKDAIISSVTVADYLLYRLNLRDAELYLRWSRPTNDISVLLDRFARYSGMLSKGGIPNIDLAAMHFIRKWRVGALGQFLLDDLEAEQQRLLSGTTSEVRMSITQALKADKRARKERSSKAGNKIK